MHALGEAPIFSSQGVYMTTRNFSLCLLFTFVLCPLWAFGDDSPDAIWSRVNDGWSGPYSELMSYLDSKKNYVVWSIIAPEEPLDLRKPDFFKKVISTKSVKKSFSISHNLVAWNCKLPSGRRVFGATGHSGESDRQSVKLVKSGYGLTAFLAKFTDGWLSGGFQTGSIFSERAKKEEIYSLVVEVSAQDCANMIGFLKKFIYHPRKPYKNFGLTLDPEKFEGAGCITFAEALLKKAKVFTEVFKASHRDLWASHFRFGGNDFEVPPNTVLPRISWREENPKKVSINEFFSANWNASLRGVKLNLIDPELLVWGYKNLSPELASRPRVVVHAGRHSHQCDEDMEDCGPRWIPVNDSYDKLAPLVSRAAKAWRNRMLKKGYKMKQTFIQNHPFIIFDR